MEGPEGWAKDKSVWRFKIGKDQDYTSYHIAIFFLALPLMIIVLPLMAAGFSWRLFYLLLGSYIFGTTLEDFFWFVFNPDRPFRSWNPNDTKWYPWFKLGRFSIPVAYVYRAIVCVIIYYLLIH